MLAMRSPLFKPRPLSGWVLAALLASPSVQALDLLKTWELARAHDPQMQVVAATRSSVQAYEAQAQALWRPVLMGSATVGAMSADTRTTGAQFSVGGQPPMPGSFATSASAAMSTRWSLQAKQALYSPERQAQQAQLQHAAGVAEWRADLAHQIEACRLIIDETARFAIRLLDAPDTSFLFGQRLWPGHYGAGSHLLEQAAANGARLAVLPENFSALGRRDAAELGRLEVGQRFAMQCEQAAGVAHQLVAVTGETLELGVPFGEAPADVFAHHGLEQVFLAREVQEQRALGHPGARGHLFHPRGGKALFDKQVERGLQQLTRAGFLAALAFGACSCRRRRGCGRQGA